MEIPREAREVLESDALAHLVTINPDGSPQVTCIWVGLEHDEIVSGHLFPQQKLRNVERDPRVAMSIETGKTNAMGLLEYLVVHGRASKKAAPPSSCKSSPTPTSAKA